MEEITPRDSGSQNQPTNSEAGDLERWARVPAGRLG
jgi:hypothetical protein